MLASQNTADYKEAFIEMMKLSAPYFGKLFGKNIWTVLEHLFTKKKNLFSYQHCFVSIKKDKIAGMVLCYGFKTKTKENVNTGLLLFKSLPFNMITNIDVLMQMNKTIGKISKRDFYISNIAVFNKFRRQGIAKNMLKELENIALKKNAEKIVLDVEAENEPAISLYKSLNYRVADKFEIGNKKLNLNFLRMKKQLK